MTDPLVTITTLAEELCDPRQHREPVYEWINRNRKLTRTIVTIQAGLLEQLRDAIYPAATIADNTSTRSIPKSRPPLLIEALSHNIEITKGANRWTWRLGLTNRGAAEANIRTLVGAASHLDNDTRHELAHDLRRWRNWAAVMTGWATPPMTPRVPCPNCSTLSSLRILPERRSALCSTCGNVWDDTDTTYTQLGQWIVKAADNPPPRLRITSSREGHGGWASRASS